MRLTKQILEAVNRGIQLALDDYEDNELNGSLSQHDDVIDSEDVIKISMEKSKFNEAIQHLYKLKLTKEDLITLAQTSNKYGFKHMFDDKEILSEVIKYISYIDPNTDLNWIDVSNITDMSELFYRLNVTTNFDVSKWDVSHVETMKGMFSNCIGFNCDISKWNVSSVKNMSYMFYKCHSFNQDLSQWDVSGVKDMEYMFCESNMSHDISNWDVSSVEFYRGFADNISKFPIFCRPKFNRN